MVDTQVHKEEWAVWNLAKKKATRSFYQGRRAFWEGALDNPNEEGTFRAKEWQRGFNEAYKTRQDKLNGQGRKYTNTSERKQSVQRKESSSKVSSN